MPSWHCNVNEEDSPKEFEIFLSARFDSKQTLYRKVCITYDTGMVSQFILAYPIFFHPLPANLLDEKFVFD